MNHDNKKTEGDINTTGSREASMAEMDEGTKEFLGKDARYFLHRSMSTPCMDVHKA